MNRVQTTIRCPIFGPGAHRWPAAGFSPFKKPLGAILFVVIACSANTWDCRSALGDFPISSSYGTTSGVPAVGQASPTSPHPSVSRIVLMGGSLSSGTGVLVRSNGRYSLVVTNYHVIRETVADPSITIVLHFPDGSLRHGAVLTYDESWDLAAIAIAAPDAPPVTLASRVPQIGEPLTIAGYGGGKYHTATGKCVKFYAPDLASPKEFVEISAMARGGDSGGPILNQRGELAGILFGSGPGYSMGPHVGRVRAFLRKAEPLFAAWDPGSQELAALSSPSGADTAASGGIRPNVTASTRTSGYQGSWRGGFMNSPTGDSYGGGSSSTASADSGYGRASGSENNAGEGGLLGRVVGTVFGVELPDPEQDAMPRSMDEVVPAETRPISSHGADGPIKLDTGQIILTLGGLLLFLMVATKLFGH